MARITIVGSGIIGMAIAHELASDHEVTIVARDLPGDEPSIEWASPWAGASFLPGGCSSHWEVQMQIDAFKKLWKWSFLYPESSIVRVTFEDIHDDDKSRSHFWWKDVMPEFHFLPADKLPKGACMGTSYRSVIFNPNIFLPWLRRRLEKSGVRFKRMTLKSLSDVADLGHEVLINATGLGSQFLLDVQDADVQMVRGQTMLVKTAYQKAFMRDDGKSYTYVLPRMDGTAILGGVRQPDLGDPAVDQNVVQDIVRRIHENLPNDFPADLSDYQILGHNVGIRPNRTSGIRIEKEVKNGQRIVHAYGFSGGGYISSFGAARLVQDHVNDFISPLTAKI